MLNYLKTLSKIAPLGIRMLPHPENAKLYIKLIYSASFLDIVPWMLSAPTVQKDMTNPETYSFISSLLQTIFHPKFSLMVQREGKESLWWLSSLNLFMNYTLTGFLLTVLYSSGNYEPFFCLSDMSTTLKKNLPDIV